MFQRYISLKAVKSPALRALLIGDALVLTAAAMLTPIYAVFVEKIGGDIFEAGITAGALAFGAGITSLLAGKYTDTLKDQKRLIAVGYAVIGAGFLLYTQVHAVWELATVQLIIGLTRPLYEPAFDALYSKHIDQKNAAEEWGSWEAMAYFTAALGALIGGFIVSTFSFQTLFIGMAVLCFASSVYVFRLPKKFL